MPLAVHGPRQTATLQATLANRLVWLNPARNGCSLERSFGLAPRRPSLRIAVEAAAYLFGQLMFEALGLH